MTSDGTTNIVRLPSGTRSPLLHEYCTNRTYIWKIQIGLIFRYRGSTKQKQRGISEKTPISEKVEKSARLRRMGPKSVSILEGVLEPKRQNQNRNRTGRKGEVSKSVRIRKGSRGRIAKISNIEPYGICLLYTSPSPRDLSTSRMPSSA